MAWSSETSATQLVNVTSEQFFSTTPTLNPRELAHCKVDVNFPGTPTDYAVVSVYGSLDGTNWDDTPLMQFYVDKAIDPNQVSFTVMGVYQFRVGVKRSGSTDTLTSADFSYRLDGVSA